MINAGGVCFQPGSVTELIFANSSGALAAGVLTIIQGGMTVAGQAGIAVTGSGTQWSVSNAHGFVGGAGINMPSIGDVHTFDNSPPV